MEFVQRKITYRLYPSATQTAALDETLALHCRAYNALLEEHKRRHEAGEPPFTFSAMCKALTSWRGYADSLAGLNAQSLQVTAKRVALAFDAFFRRVKAGDTPGYPRFKPLQRFAGWGYKTYGDGWKLHQEDGVHGKVRLSGIGLVPMRGKGRFSGTPKTAEVLHQSGKWYLSVTYDVAPEAVARKPGTEAGAFDWGLTTLLTLAKADGSLEEVDNPRGLKQKLDAIKTLQRVISAEEAKAKAQLGLAPDEPLKPGQRLPVNAKLKRLYAQLRAIHGKVARQRKDFYHKLTALLVSRFAFLGTEELAVANMAKRPKKKEDAATGEALPNGASAKAGLNRGILDAAPSMLIGMLKTKAEEAGSWFALANTRAVKPTQRCHCCGALVKKTLSERAHRCACGCECGRDENFEFSEVFPFAFLSTAAVVTNWLLFKGFRYLFDNAPWYDVPAIARVMNIIQLPGIVLHEGMHWLAAKLTGESNVTFQAYPPIWRGQSGVTFGRVTFAHRDRSWTAEGFLSIVPLGMLFVAAMTGGARAMGRVSQYNVDAYLFSVVLLS